VTGRRGQQGPLFLQGEVDDGVRQPALPGVQRTERVRRHVLSGLALFAKPRNPGRWVGKRRRWRVKE
jgi:hypothetical protein